MASDLLIIHYRLKRRRLTKPETLIPLKEYAELHHLTESTVRRRIRAGHVVGFKRAGKWFVRRDPLWNE